MPHPIIPIDGVSVFGQKVIIRVDLNVPTKDGVILDDSRLKRSLKTILSVLTGGGIPILLSHFGQPAGSDPRYSLKFLTPILEKLTGYPVVFVPDILMPGDLDGSKPRIYLLENTRFWPGEKSGDQAFARHLASFGSIYVNDAFSASHRPHASISGIPNFLPAYGGYLLVQEIQALDAALKSPKRPMAAIVGGAKVSSKIPLLKNLLQHVDYLILSGGIANTFLAAKGHAIGCHSLWEPSYIAAAQDIMAAASAENVNIILPQDGAGIDNGAFFESSLDEIPENGTILDIGPRSVAAFESILKTVRTVVWNGPLGAFETGPFDGGSVAIAQFIARQTQKQLLYSVAGGGETNAVLKKAGVLKDFTYVSAAGGAFLAYLEGAPLPGILALQQSMIP